MEKKTLIAGTIIIAGAVIIPLFCSPATGYNNTPSSIEQVQEQNYYQTEEYIIFANYFPEVTEENGTVIIQAANRDENGWNKGSLDEKVLDGLEEKEIEFNGERITIHYNPEMYQLEQGDPHTWYLIKNENPNQ